MGVIRCCQCKAELPASARKDWGYKLGNSMYFCTYGCMRAKQEDIKAKQQETYARRAAEKAKKQEEKKMGIVAVTDMANMQSTEKPVEQEKNQEELQEIITRQRKLIAAQEKTVLEQQDKIKVLTAERDMLRERAHKLGSRCDKLMETVKLLIEMNDEDVL